MEVSNYDAEERSSFVQNASSKSTLDGVLLCYYYNNFRKRWGPGIKPPDISVSEVFPSLSDADTFLAVARCAQMFQEADRPAMARLGYSGATESYDDALARFLSHNPGFSDESYDLALHAAMVNNR